jgi:hypothetical protein
MGHTTFWDFFPPDLKKNIIVYIQYYVIVKKIKSKIEFASKFFVFVCLFVLAVYFKTIYLFNHFQFFHHKRPKHHQ